MAKDRLDIKSVTCHSESTYQGAHLKMGIIVLTSQICSENKTDMRQSLIYKYLVNVSSFSVLGDLVCRVLGQGIRASGISSRAGEAGPM